MGYVNYNKLQGLREYIIRLIKKYSSKTSGTGFSLLGSDTVANIRAKDPSNAGDAWVALDTGVDDNATPVAIGDALATDGTQWTNIGPIEGEKGDTGATGPQGEQGPGVGTGATPIKVVFTGGETSWDSGETITDSHQLFYGDGTGSLVLLQEGVDYTKAGSVYTFLAPITTIPITAGDVMHSYPNIAVPDTSGGSYTILRKEWRLQNFITNTRYATFKEPAATSSSFYQTSVTNLGAYSVDDWTGYVSQKTTTISEIKTVASCEATEDYTIYLVAKTFPSGVETNTLLWTSSSISLTPEVPVITNFTGLSISVNQGDRLFVVAFRTATDVGSTATKLDLSIEINE